MNNSKLYFEYNPWWEGKFIPKKYRFSTKRKVFIDIKKDITKDNRIICLVGPRRVGKTVLLYQIIETLLKNRISPKRIFYLSADDPSLLIDEHIIKDAIDFFEKNIFRSLIKESRQPVFFFLDEIQAVEKWAEYLKKYLDLAYPIKFVISGSSSIKMVKNTRESLVGRSKEYILPPLSFSEFLQWQDPTLSQSFNLFDIRNNFKKLENKYKEFFLKKRKYQYYFEKYLSLGGFPECYSLSEWEKIDYLKKEVVERVLFKDIPEVTKIKNPQLTSRLLTLSSFETANIVSYQNLSQKIGSRFETIVEHLFYLEYSFLISLLKKYGRGGLSIAKTQPKIHVVDPALILSLTNKSKTIFTEKDFLGRLVESLVVNHLRFSIGYENIFFWRDERNEVDIILNFPDLILPIEVKYTTVISKKDLSSLSSFKNKYKTSIACVLTEDYFGKSENVIFMPVWFFLLGEFKTF